MQRGTRFQTTSLCTSRTVRLTRMGRIWERHIVLMNKEDPSRLRRRRKSRAEKIPGNSVGPGESTMSTNTRRGWQNQDETQGKRAEQSSSPPVPTRQQLTQHCRYTAHKRLPGWVLSNPSCTGGGHRCAFSTRTKTRTCPQAQSQIQQSSMRRGDHHDCGGLSIGRQMVDVQQLLAIQ